MLQLLKFLAGMGWLLLLAYLMAKGLEMEHLRK